MATRWITMLLCAAAMAVPPKYGHAEQVATMSASRAAPYRSKQARLRSPLAAADARALVELHELHDRAIGVGRLAQSRARSLQTRQSAQQIALDHTRRDQLVVSFARLRRVQLIAATPIEAGSPRVQHGQATIDRLQELTGAEFDREFVQAMLDDNAGAILLVARQRAGVHDPDLRMLLDATLPMLKEHLALARELVHQRS